MFIYYVFMHVNMCMPWHTWGGGSEANLGVFLSTLWVPGTELRSSDLAAGTRTQRRHLSGLGPSVFQRTVLFATNKQKTNKQKKLAQSTVLKVVTTCVSLSLVSFIPRTSTTPSFPGTEGVQDPQSHASGCLWAAVVLELYC